MSSVRRARSDSVARTFSNRFFSRITFWDWEGFDQRFGSAACFSTSVSCSRSLPASKVLPEIVDFRFQLGVLLFQIFVHVDHSVLLRDRKVTANAAIKIIAHRFANQSPC